MNLFRPLTEFRIALELNTNSLLVVIEQNSDNLLLAHNVQVGVVAALELVVHISVSGILSPSVGPDVLQPPLSGVVRIEVLQVLELTVAHVVRRVDEGLLSLLAAVRALRDVDGATVAVGLAVTHAVVVLELIRSQRVYRWRCVRESSPSS
jgi:hypothetical protein